MYRLQIMSAEGMRELRWDPRKLRENDPATVAMLAEADRALHRMVAQRQRTAVAPAAQRVTVLGRWDQPGHQQARPRDPALRTSAGV